MPDSIDRLTAGLAGAGLDAVGVAEALWLWRAALTGPASGQHPDEAAQLAPVPRPAVTNDSTASTDVTAPEGGSDPDRLSVFAPATGPQTTRRASQVFPYRVHSQLDRLGLMRA